MLLAAAACLGSCASPVHVQFGTSQQPPAEVSAVYASPAALGSGGGRVAVAGQVSHAVSCRLVLLSAQPFPVVYASNSRPCTSGFTAHVLVGPNPYRYRRTIPFALVASNPVSSFTGRFGISLAANSSLRAVILNGAPQPDYNSAFAGYAVVGQHLTQISGTFTVPRMASDATCHGGVDMWAGISGYSIGPLIQAGVHVDQYSLTTGKCTPGHSYAYAWWEIYPENNAVYIPTINVVPGDRMTVDIWQASHGRWEIGLTDDTNRQGFTTSRLYRSPETMADWVTEATFDSSLCGKGVDPGYHIGICELAPYSPPVRFTDLWYTGDKLWMYDYITVQDGRQKARPSPLVNDGFTVPYDNTSAPPGS